MYSNLSGSSDLKSPITVLLVDDDEIARFLWKRAIESSEAGMLVKESSNGLEALNFLKNHWNEPLALPDIIFLDINMPVMNGLAFLDEYAKLSKTSDIHIPIYILSSSIMPEEMAKINNSPAVSGFIPKPFKMEKFEKIMQTFNETI